MSTNTQKNQKCKGKGSYLAEHPVDHDLLTGLGIHGLAEKRLDLLVVEALEIRATQKCVMGGDGA